MNEGIMQNLQREHVFFLKAADGVRLVVLLDGRGRMVDEIGMEGMENVLPSL